MKNELKYLAVGALALSVAGCASRRMASNSGAPQFQPPPPPRMVTTLPPGAIVVPPGSVPPGSFPQGSPPAGSFPTAPSSPAFAPQPPPGPSNSFPVSPPSVPPSSSSIPPGEALDRVGYRWQPTNPPAQPASPPAQPAGPPTVLLLPPTPEPGASEPKQQPRTQLYPPQSNEPSASTLPVGIFGFDKARDHIATGQRPTLEGLDWLQKSGYRVVVFLHAPGEMTDTDRQQVEKRGMTFVPIEINARDLSRVSVDRFLALQKDSKGEKVFVYDLDGSISGAMWYLSYCLIDQDNEEIARIKGSSLGMGEGREAARELWQSAKKVIEAK